MNWRFGLLICLCFFASCSSKEKRPSSVYGPTLADLPSQEAEQEEPLPIPVTNLDQIEDSYRSALEVASDPDIRHQILVRLADIEMARSENEQIEIAEQREFFTDAISMYEELIQINQQKALSGESVNNERLLYQLSKAYALDGRIEESDEALERLVTDYPTSGFSAEADFRQAELSFTNRDYAGAEALYAKVISEGDETPFYTNAVYMQGWSRFKRGRYRASIQPFTEVLDRTLIEGEDFDALSNSKKNLAKDTLRILSIVFSYLDGAETITEVYEKLGERHYQFMLYANLGELYYEKERYRDSADTYLHYVREFPDTDQSPAFAVKAIDVYDQGNFPSLILPAKEEFVKNYGAYSDFWKKRNDEQREQLRPYLKTYLVELSSYYHAEAQALDTQKVEYDKLAEAGKKPKKKPEEAQPNYLRAAELYGEFVFTFPQDEQTPEMTFLQAEAYYSAGYLAESVDSFEVVAYQYLDKKRGADSGYSAVLIMSEIIAQLPASENEKDNKELLAWQTRKINSAISFSDYYSTDERAVPVLTKASQELFEQGELPRAATIAQRLTEWQPPQSVELQKTAWLILAHSRFDLEQYSEAEWAYRELLTRMEPTDPQYTEVIDRIAASIYRQAEFQLAAGNRAGAVALLLSVRDVAPNSDIAATAQYDAANHLIAMQDWARAEQELDEFKRRYPNHELNSTLAPKYALVYQESQQWGKAAAVLTAMSLSGDPEAQRTSLYLSAELYEKAENYPKAIENYRKYAHTYPEPFDIATEARFNLVELYETTGEPEKRRFWLNKLIEANADAGNLRTDRSRSLAAMAMSEFAEDEYQSFASIRLTLPIKKSMKRKKTAMDRTLKYYTEIMEFGIADYVTLANHRIGTLYSTLSRDLMDSQRPKGLDALALEQYEILLEEQAFPFEEKAVEIYKGNTERTQQGIYDEWVKASFTELSKILPARYGKQEKRVELVSEIN